MAYTYATARSGGRTPPHAPSRKRGTWKLAYADFLTALCAFFLVMWMINTPTNEREGVAEYFSGEARHSVYVSKARSNGDAVSSELKRAPGFEAFQKNIAITQTEDFVRLDLFDTSDQPLFSNGSAELNAIGTGLVQAAGKFIAQKGWHISIEGHTDSNIIHSGNYSNWDLSAERANVARRTLEVSGINSANFQAVTGLADTQPLLPAASHLPANRRISIVIHLMD